MVKISKCLGSICLVILVICASMGAFLMWAYQVVDDGELNLPNAPGNAVIVREKETGIAHIRGDSFRSVAYAQGFSHA